MINEETIYNNLLYIIKNGDCFGISCKKCLLNGYKLDADTPLDCLTAPNIIKQNISNVILTKLKIGLL
jgi:hypothetical protein